MTVRATIHELELFDRSIWRLMPKTLIDCDRLSLPVMLDLESEAEACQIFEACVRRKRLSGEYMARKPPPSAQEANQ